MTWVSLDSSETVRDARVGTHEVLNEIFSGPNHFDADLRGMALGVRGAPRHNASEAATAVQDAFAARL